jgi:hypothetical protein
MNGKSKHQHANISSGSQSPKTQVTSLKGAGEGPDEPNREFNSKTFIVSPGTSPQEVETDLRTVTETAKESVGRRPDEPSEQLRAKPPRLSAYADRSGPTIMLDGKHYAVKYEFALLVRTLIKERGWLSMRELFRMELEIGDRADRVRDSQLADYPELGKLFESGHKGFRIAPEYLD